MSLTRILIVGAGHGGVQAAASLRDAGFDGELVLIGDEPGPPYHRPPLSKAYIKDGDASRLQLRAEVFYERERIERRDQTRVVAIDRDRCEATIADGERLPYDHLILATGAINRRPPVAGLDLPGVVELRNLADADAIRARLPHMRRAVVIGGGFIGLEFAAVGRAAGVEVAVVEAQPRLMARAISPATSQRFLEAHRAAGAAIHLEVFAEAVLAAPGGDVGGARLSNGTVLEADMVLVAAGVAPNVALAEAAGLEIDNGVVVDAELVTSDPKISAIGDCAAFPGPGGAMLRLESVQAATDQARHVARRLTGGAPGAYDQTPWFWSDQGPMKLQIAGLPSRADRFETRPGALADVAAGFLVAGFAGDQLICVETVNEQGQHMAARKLLGTGRAVSAAEVAAAGFDFRALFKQAAAG